MKVNLTRDNLRMTFRLFVGTGEEREGQHALRLGTVETLVLDEANRLCWR